MIKVSSKAIFPTYLRSKITKVEKIEKTTPSQMGHLNKIQRATAEPMISCISAQIMAISTLIQRDMDTGRL